MVTGRSEELPARDRIPGDMVLGMDMGGTRLRAALVDRQGNIGDVVHYPVPADQAAQARLPVAVAQRFSDEASAVGLAIAGTVTAGVVTWAANLRLAGADLGTQLRMVSHGQAAVVNDARAAGAAEARLGAAAGEHLVLAITVGTGIGGAIILDGKPLEGRGTAGEVGHMVLRPDGPPCGCGRRGCWETLSGGRALDRAAATVLRGDGNKPSARDLVRAAEQGIPAAISELDRAAGDFRSGLENLCAVLSPDLIILGGGVIARGGLVSEAYLGAAAGLRWGAATRITQSQLGDQAGLVGAAMLARDFLPSA